MGWIGKSTLGARERDTGLQGKQIHREERLRKNRKYMKHQKAAIGTYNIYL